MSNSLQTFETLVRKYNTVCVRIAASVTGDMDTAQDVAQESLIKAYRNWDTFDPSRSFLPWMTQIIKRTYFDMLRARNRETDYVAKAHLETTETGDLRTEIEAADIQERVQAALHLIPDNSREVIELYHLAGFGYEEVASILSIPVGTVMSRLYNARKHLRMALEDSGLAH